MSTHAAEHQRKQPDAPTVRNSASDFAAALLAVVNVAGIDPATVPVFLALMDVAAGRTSPFPMADRYIGRRLARRSGVALEFETSEAGDRAYAERFKTAWKLADAEQQRTGHRLAERRRGGLRGADREKMRRVASTYTVHLVEIVPEVIRRARANRAFYGPRRAEMYEQVARDVLSERPQDYESEKSGKLMPKERRAPQTKADDARTDPNATRVIKSHLRLVKAAVENVKRRHLTEAEADALRFKLIQQIEDEFSSLFTDPPPAGDATGLYYSVDGNVVQAAHTPDEPDLPPFDLAEEDPPVAPIDADGLHANYTSIFTKVNVYEGENETDMPSACIVEPSERTPRSTPKATPSDSLELLTQALTYASFGWHVFPVHSWTGDACTCGKTDCENAAKHPIYSLAPNGFKNATTDAATITSWWTKAPFANIGIATGKVSDLLVLDIDPKHGGWEGLRALLERLGEPFPATVEAITGSDGRHFLFKMPEADIRNSSGKLGAGLDVRANGGYVVAAPSLHRSGKRYQWASDEASLEHAPYKLVRELTEPERRVPREDATPTGFSSRVGSTPGNIAEGGRNDTLFRRAAAMRGAGASEDEIFNALHDLNASCVPPLAARELSKIAASAATYPTNGRQIV